MKEKRSDACSGSILSKAVCMDYGNGDARSTAVVQLLNE
jgi:hypothetical protein